MSKSLLMSVQVIASNNTISKTSEINSSEAPPMQLALEHPEESPVSTPYGQKK